MRCGESPNSMSTFARCLTLGKAYKLLCVCLKDVALGESFSEAMHTDSKVNSMDANLSGPDEVSAGTSLQDATSMAENETSVDECRRSESLIYSQEPTPTVRCHDLTINVTHHQF